MALEALAEARPLYDLDRLARDLSASHRFRRREVRGGRGAHLRRLRGDDIERRRSIGHAN